MQSKSTDRIIQTSRFAAYSAQQLTYYSFWKQPWWIPMIWFSVAPLHIWSCAFCVMLQLCAAGFGQKCSCTTIPRKLWVSHPVPTCHLWLESIWHMIVLWRKWKKCIGFQGPETRPCMSKIFHTLFEHVFLFVQNLFHTRLCSSMLINPLTGALG